MLILIWEHIEHFTGKVTLIRRYNRDRLFHWLVIWVLQSVGITDCWQILGILLLRLFSSCFYFFMLLVLLSRRWRSHPPWFTRTMCSKKRPFVKKISEMFFHKHLSEMNKNIFTSVFFCGKRVNDAEFHAWVKYIFRSLISSLNNVNMWKIKKNREY